MENCRFAENEHPECGCKFHHRGPALCAHAAQELQDAHRKSIDHLVRVAGVLTRYQPAGSPPPGDMERLAEWILSALQRRMKEYDACASQWARDNTTLQSRLASLEAANARLREAAQDFVDKVESGRARSTDSYKKFKTALSPDAGGTEETL